MIRARFFGTAGAWRIPRPGCRCPQCVSADPRDRRTRSSIYLDCGVLVDCGPDFASQYESARYPRITDVLITHAHHDHVLGLRDLCPEYACREEICLWAAEPTLERIRSIQGDLPFSERVIQPGASVAIAGLTVSFLPVDHSDTTPAYGILIDDRLFYAPDMRSLPEQTEMRARGVDTAILDASLPKKRPENHQSFIDAVSLANRLDAGRLFGTHVGHGGVPHRELEVMAQRPRHQVAWDGLTVEVGR